MLHVLYAIVMSMYNVFRIKVAVTNIRPLVLAKEDGQVPKAYEEENNTLQVETIKVVVLDGIVDVVMWSEVLVAVSEAVYIENSLPCLFLNVV